MRQQMFEVTFRGFGVEHPEAPYRDERPTIMMPAIELEGRMKALRHRLSDGITDVLGVEISFPEDGGLRADVRVRVPGASRQAIEDQFYLNAPEGLLLSMANATYPNAHWDGAWSLEAVSPVVAAPRQRQAPARIAMGM